MCLFRKRSCAAAASSLETGMLLQWHLHKLSALRRVQEGCVTLGSPGTGLIHTAWYGSASKQKLQPEGRRMLRRHLGIQGVDMTVHDGSRPRMQCVTDHPTRSNGHVGFHATKLLFQPMIKMVAFCGPAFNKRLLLLRCRAVPDHDDQARADRGACSAST